jgi:hypothetical protein
MWPFKRAKRFKGAPIIETHNNILLPLNQEIYKRIEQAALKEIREKKEAESTKVIK